ncbi:DUF4126 family protein [Spongiibacter nanhainus]|uniref:DUF4126 family protein n=1 Tax=Spongiibacter nanhainus TaxID=2794344 RepID=A0A7T4R0F4_9GAMM|nr:DUF4126 family protein [Spongiibacter nanhainus]QQD18135.1 DUF4126 family protein [Spongiibacter nanhainus]
MEEYQQLISIISVTMGVAWASGINLYAAILVLGLGGSMGGIDLPESLEIVQDPAVIMAAVLMYGVEFFADKVPGVDTGWDTLHTFIRIPAGALLAASSVGDVSPALQLAAGIVGGSVTSVTHAAKASSRVMINTSPEPVTNWLASISEDVAVIGGLWVALNHPLIFLAIFTVFILLVIWLLPKLWRGVSRIFRKLGSWLGLVEVEQQEICPLPEQSPGEKLVDELQRLSELHASGRLSDEEYVAAKEAVIRGSSSTASSTSSRGAAKGDRGTPPPANEPSP